MAERRRRVKPAEEPNLPEIEYPEASPAPRSYRTYTLDAPGYQNWQFTCIQPDMKNWAKAMEIAGPIFDQITEGTTGQQGQLSPGEVIRYFQKFGNLWEDVARVAAQVVVSWNFRDVDGSPLPSPYKNYKVIVSLPTAVARPFGMEVLNFLAWTSGGEEEAECSNCGAAVQVAWAYCPECREPTQLRCPDCNRPAEPSWQVCPYCGVEVRSSKN